MSQPQPTPSSAPQTDLDLKQMANAIRILALDAVKNANSGHTGMPMGMADIATVLYSKFLKFDPKNPHWFNRDRVIISNGHGSMLPYSLSYLTGNEKITIEEIKNFRQLGSHTPGHPEVDVDAAIETTTGPLGQGISNAVGFAIAERVLNAKHGDKVDHFTYVFVGDGCLMEGVSHESCSLAGHLGLSKMIAFFDDNEVTIDGRTDISSSDDVKKRFESYGWEISEVDGHDHGAIEKAIEAAQKSDKPSFIACKTKIGYGCPTLESQPKAHGAITGDEEIAGVRQNLGWSHAPFDIPDDILSMWRSLGVQGDDWSPEVDFSGLDKVIAELKESFATDKPTKATRQLSGACLEKILPALESMIGGSADLTGSNNTKVSDSKVITKDDYNGNYINYGVREHGMAAIMNGIALHGGIIPYAGTFMQFADYSRPAIRLAALMEQRVIHVLTHDSIGLGEDGPTHQPVEHLAALRAIPNCYVYRPCDGIETAECWELALKQESAPSVLALTRQGVPPIREEADPVNKCELGAYILEDCAGDEPEVTLFASGSEVQLAMEASERLGDGVRVVSVPCMERFWEQDGEYIQSLLCNNSIKVAVEAGIRQSWDRMIGGHNPFIGMDSFGASAPADQLFKHFGITADAIVEAVESKRKG
ncbi:MAG: transketolase [Alphaproteobacteria bacterium]|nr:transketolase [Alphaproteobacteria bacterium]